MSLIRLYVYFYDFYVAFVYNPICVGWRGTPTDDSEPLDRGSPYEGVVTDDSEPLERGVERLGSNTLKNDPSIGNVPSLTNIQASTNGVAPYIYIYIYV